MLIRAGYASDGASGPMPDIQTVMRAAFVHDAASQLLELGVLLEEHRKAVDALLRSVSIDAGMWPPLAALVHNSVDTFGGLYRANRHDVILSAP